MAYVQPCGIIKLCKGVPLDNKYEHTLLFETTSGGKTASQKRYDYFSSKSSTALTFNLQSYQRVNSNTLKIAVLADDILECNYLMFMNKGSNSAPYSARWFYAFITNISYINEHTTQVEYEIDVMQSFDDYYTLLDCFVERTHTLTDYVGDNLVPENLETGEYVTDGLHRFVQANGNPLIADYGFCVAAVAKYKDYSDWTKGVEKAYGGTYNGVFQGVWLYTFNTSDDAVGFCHQVESSNLEGSIVACFVVPKNFIGTRFVESGQQNLAPSVYDPSNNSSTIITKGEIQTDATGIAAPCVDGWFPNNFKLFTYPYSFLYLTNMQGNSAVYQYEFFTESGCGFRLSGDYSCNPSVTCAPINYKGTNKKNDAYLGYANYDEKIVLSNFPQLAYNGDAFKAWLAQNASSLGVNVLSSAVSLVTAGQIAKYTPLAPTRFDQLRLDAQIRGGLASGLTGTLSSVATVADHARMPLQSHGSQSPMAGVVQHEMDIFWTHKSVSYEFAKIIDSFFDMYGYAVNKVMTPIKKSRSEWTYIKTGYCELSGDLPTPAADKIKDIYNNGITFWVNPSHVGLYSRYSVNNRATNRGFRTT